ncbi:hypothetical protein GDO86_014604 [Hymenochirus boettgeri]|uniref:Uncharacterized protein n=1 Tax=Hymenochirus boettgeri TaxID=247094 RepID=A0A8T2JTI7_9PIPI|nr:hypothetical protein GDO86_014604 [Hymenochirus boettgeri]
MASADLRDDLNCPICTDIYTDPVTLPCGHNYCQGCIEKTSECSTHHKILEYYCCEDGACVCVSCCLAGDHRGHKVELLDEASEKKKEKLRNVLDKLTPQREATERKVQRLQENWGEVKRKAASEMERVTVLFRDIREQLKSLEKRVLSEISRQEKHLSLTLTNLIQQLEIRKDELSSNISHIEKLCRRENCIVHE